MSSENQRDRLRKAIGLKPNERRYPRDDFNSLDEISDSHTLEDETKTSVTEYVAENTMLAFFAGLAGLFMLGLGVYLTLKLAPDVLSNPWTWRIIIGGSLLGGTAMIVRRSTIQRFLQYDWLVLMNRSNPKLYVGYHLQPDGDADYPIFVPVKGFTAMGTREHFYRVGEVAPDNSDGGFTPTDPDDPATVRLHPDFSGVAQTPFGQLVVQLSRGFRYDGYGTETTLVAGLPDMAAEDRVEDLTNALEDAQHQISKLEDDLATEKENRKDAEANAKRRRKEIREELKEDARELNPEYYRGRRGRRSSQESEQAGASPEPDFGDIEEDLNASS